MQWLNRCIVHHLGDGTSDLAKHDRVRVHQTTAQRGCTLKKRGDEESAAFNILNVLPVPFPEASRRWHALRQLPCQIQIPFDFIEGCSIQSLAKRSLLGTEDLVRALKRKDVLGAVCRFLKSVA